MCAPQREKCEQRISPWYFHPPDPGPPVAHSRREFLKTGAAAAATTAIGARILAGGDILAASRPRPTIGDPATRELMQVALDVAKGSGASYADVRVSARRQQNVNTRDKIVQGVSDNDTFGIGVRTLVDGAWGFAATSQLTKDAVAGITKSAIAQAKANRASQLHPVVLAPTPGNQVGEWKSPITTDPFTIPIVDKVALLLAANEQAAKVKQVRNVTSSMSSIRSSARTPPGGRTTPLRNSRQSRSSRGSTISCCIRPTSGSRCTRPSRIPRSSIARWATRPITPAPVSSRPRRKCSASSSSDRAS